MTNEAVKFLHDTHYTEGKKVTFKNKGLKMAGLIFFPENFDENIKYPAIVFTHPGGGVKEQCSSLYCYNLSKAGYVALAFDASHQGESEGEPRFLEDPTARVEDIRSAIDYLVTLPYIDEDNIGAAGICAGAGYTMNATQTEHRIKAGAGICTWDTGHSAKYGNPGEHDPKFLQETLAAVAKQRTKEARGEDHLYIGYLPETPADFTEKTSTIMKEGTDYYRTPRCGYPTSQNKVLITSYDRLAAFDAFAHMDIISPRAVLLIVGSKADTHYFSQAAFDKAKEPKEWYEIKGASHIDLYDKPEYVNQAVAKLIEYFGKYLKK